MSASGPDQSRPPAEPAPAPTQEPLTPDQQQLSQQDLADSRRLLLTLMSNLPGMVYRCANDPNWTMLFVSDGCLELTGYPPADLINNRRISYNDIIHPEDRQRIWDAVQTGVTTNQPFQFTYRIITADGRTKWVWEQGRGVFSPTGQLEALEGYITDITDRRFAEERIRLLAMAVEQIYEGVAIADMNGRLFFVNRAIETIHGYKSEELLGKNLSIFHSPEQMPAVEKALHEIRSLGHFKGELGHRRRDGITMVLYMHTSLVRDEQGKPIAMVATMRDISEQKKAEEELRKERNFNLTLVQACPAFFVAISAQGKTIMMNPAMLQALGYTHDEVVGKDYLATFVPPEEHESLGQVFHRLTTTNEPTFNENHVLARDGRQILVEWHGRQVYKPDGQLDYFFGVGIDITQRRKAEQERARLEAQLYQAQKLEAVGQLAGGIAHDFNNLLVVIMGNASMVKRDASLPPKVREAVGDIMSAAERGSALTQQLLAYARGGLQQPTATDLNRLIRSVVPMLERTAPARIKFDFQLADDLPTVVADPPRIEQVLVNLCLNAIQATTPPGTVTVATSAVTLDPAAAAELQINQGRYLRLDVTDQGCGIEPEIQDKIFEPFFSTKEMGRGLGLSVTHGIVQSHRGQIRVRSQPGRGTTVSVWLPASDQPEAAVMAPDLKFAPPRPPRGSETILVIDDEPVVACALEKLLSSLGYCVVCHTDADQALAFLGTNAEDLHLVLCDLTMPKHSGRDIANIIARKYPHIAVLLISGYDAETVSSQLRGTRAGFVAKPFSLMALAQAVRDALDRAQSG